jgi:putative exosortase-associated protein (TIGR04073 family)
MKRFVGIVFMFLLIAGFTTLAHADQGVMATQSEGEVMTQKAHIRAYRLTVGEKAARGVKNILLGWTELPKRIVDITQETENPIWGLVIGIYEGSLKAVGRTLSGVVDVLTAPIDPEKAPWINPDIEKM